LGVVLESQIHVYQQDLVTVLVNDLEEPVAQHLAMEVSQESHPVV
jgi:hypothetical protein